MHKPLRIFTSMLVAGALLLQPSFSAFARDDVSSLGIIVPAGTNKNLEFEDGAGNLFQFGDALPGDTSTQTITVKNKRNEKVYVYLKPVSIQNAALLDQLRLTVSSGNQILYSGSLSGKVTTASGSQQSINQNGIPLGICQPLSNHYVTAKIEVPVTVDNTFADANGGIKWAFYAEYAGGSGGGGGGSSGGGGSGGSGGSSGSRSSGGSSQRDTDPERNIARILDEDVPLGGSLYTIADDQTPTTPLPRTGGRQR